MSARYGALTISALEHNICTIVHVCSHCANIEVTTPNDTRTVAGSGATFTVYGELVAGSGATFTVYDELVAGSGATFTLYGELVAGSGATFTVYNELVAGSGATFTVYDELVAGSGATFTVYDEVQHTNRDGSDYCPRICYFYSFWFYIIGYVFLLLAVIYCAVLGLIMCLSISSHSDSRRR